MGRGSGNVNKIDVGPSGVCALPLAAGLNEGGHYFRYFSSSSSCYLVVVTTAIHNHIFRVF